MLSRFLRLLLVGSAALAFQPGARKARTSTTKERIRHRGLGRGKPLKVKEQSAVQLTTNLIRDCATKNKEDAMKILYSTEVFTRKGKRRLRGLLSQLCVSTPVAEPTTSTLLDGTWERQGQHPRRVKTIELKAGRNSMMYTYDFYVGGLVKITQFWATVTLDNARFSLRQEFVRANVGGFEFRLPPTFRTQTTEVLYLDSDLFICKRSGSKSDDIYLKPTEGRGVMQRSLRRSSPLRLRQRSMALLRNVWDLLGLGRRRKAAPSGPDNMIGGLDWRAEAPAPWQTEENLLEQAAEADIDFNVQDLLEGRVKRRLKKKTAKSNDGDGAEGRGPSS